MDYHIFKMPTAPILLAACLLNGCTTSASKMDYIGRMEEGGPGVCLTLTEDDIDTNYGSTVTVGAVLGGIVGSVLGVAAGAAAAYGGQDPVPLIIGGAAGGFALGAGLGAIDGVEVADKKEAYALQEAQLDCQLDALKEDNSRLAKLVYEMRISVKETEKRLTDLEADYVAKRVSKDAALKDLGEIDDSSSQIQRTITAMKKKRDAYVTAKGSTQTAANNQLDTRELDQQIDSSHRQIDACERMLIHLLERRKVARFG